MKNFLLFFTVLFVSSQIVKAQAYEGKIEYQKTQQPVAICEVPYQESVVEDAIKEYMTNKGYKGSGSSGFTLYKGAKLDKNDSVLSDLYFKIEHKSRKEREVTVISLLPAKSNEVLATRSPTDNSKIDQAKAFLDQITPYIDSYQLKLQVTEQDNSVRKLHKKLDNLVDDQISLEKKLRKLSTDLDQNKIDQQKQANLIQQDVNQDEAGLQKAHKKLSHLLDDQADFQKKLRKTQAELDQNKSDQANLKEELLKQQQLLDTMKAKQKSTGT